MTDAGYSFAEVRFIIGEESTDVFALLLSDGLPSELDGWHHKVFPASSVENILGRLVDAVTWPPGDPPETYSAPEHDSVVTPVDTPLPLRRESPEDAEVADLIAEAHACLLDGVPLGWPGWASLVSRLAAALRRLSRRMAQGKEPS